MNDLVLGEEANSRFKAHWAENKTAENDVNFSVHVRHEHFYTTEVWKRRKQACIAKAYFPLKWVCMFNLPLLNAYSGFDKRVLADSTKGRGDPSAGYDGLRFRWYNYSLMQWLWLFRAPLWFCKPSCGVAFQKYFTRNFERRTLNWVHFLGDAIVRFEPKKGKRYDLKVTSLQVWAVNKRFIVSKTFHLPQATVLMALNCRPGGDSFGLEEIMGMSAYLFLWFRCNTGAELLGMEKDVIKRLLHSMSCHKIKVSRA